ncbi:ComEA family DNA-binding protein [Pseudocnuella soli]|uniref:ComEA family DNA-binding protein n=1 Tax=Pseudocnuella soli TaxID=2502779 RepID=UPI0010498BA8|nr:helix-hairpin-helix domain-containing protein [Pseudocnuella soli]
MKLACTILFMVLASAMAGQELPLNARQQLELVAEANEEEPEDDALLQQLIFWQKRPLNLNVADAADLQVFPFLTPVHIHHFLAYRNLLGPFIDLHELQSIPGWELHIIRQLLPFVQVQPAMAPVRNLLQRLHGGEHQTLLRTTRVVQQSEGFKKSGANGFAGDRQQALFRHQYRNTDGLQWGVTAEKDAGETIFKKGHATPDFLSAHLFIRRMGKIKALAIGDFTANMGQGLVHWQALAFGKGPAAVAIKRQSSVLRPYASAGEALFLRGAGATLQHKSWEATVFAARQKIGANTDINELGESVISSFDVSGLHRTATELAKRKTVGQQVFGGNVQYGKGLFNWGLNTVYYHLSLPVEKRDEPYNLHALKGRSYLNYSTDYSFTWRNLHLFGELAANAPGKYAWVQGLVASIHPRIDMALHVRMMQPGYTTMAASAFTEGTVPTNEQGIYWGVQMRPHAKLVVNAYADVFRFPWLRFRVGAPSTGSDFLLQATYQPQKGTEWYVRYRARQKDRNVPGAGWPLELPLPYRQQNVRLHAGKNMGLWVLRSRAEMVWWQQDAKKQERGMLVYGEAQYKGNKRIEVSGRLAYFKTDSYDTRLYAFETDVLYGYSIPPLFGEGFRGYLVVHGDVNKNISVWLRAAHFFYPGAQSVGTGLNRIDGKGRTELKMQALIKF